MTLLQKRCVACTSDTPPLTPKEAAALARQVPEWAVEDNRQLRRSFRFKDFATALAFVNRIGAAAEEEDHHPDISFGWGKAEVVYSTHSIGGLSENDFIMAAKTDALATNAPGIRREKQGE